MQCDSRRRALLCVIVSGKLKKNSDGFVFIARFKKWFRDCGGRLVRDVCVFGVGDLPAMSTAHQLFANKFYADLQPMALRCLEELHYNKTRDDMMGIGKSRLAMAFYRRLPNVINHVPSGLERFGESDDISHP